MHTYRELMAHREFRVLWATMALNVAAGTTFSLSLSVLVYRQTGSALLSALTMFGPMLAQVLGATTLMSVADTSPPRRTLTLLALVTATAFCAQAALDLPVLVRVLLVLGAAYVTSIGSGARWGLLIEVLPHDGYALGRSAMNIAVGVMQVVGYATGGLLLQALQTQQIFAIGAALVSLTVPVTWFGLREHAPRRSTRAGLRATWAGNRELLALPSTRPLLVALCVPNGLVVGCEALFVPYAGDGAAALFVAGAAGMFAGDLVVGRYLSVAGRRRAGQWLRLLLAAPFMLFVLHPALPLAVVLTALATAGYAASLAQQEMLVTLTPAHLSGQVLGVEGSARMTWQGLGALLAGATADMLDVGLTMTLLAVASLTVSLALTPSLGRAGRLVARRLEATSAG